MWEMGSYSKHTPLPHEQPHNLGPQRTCDIRLPRFTFPRFPMYTNLSTRPNEMMKRFVGYTQIAWYGIWVLSRSFVARRANLCITDSYEGFNISTTWRKYKLISRCWQDLNFLWHLSLKHIKREKRLRLNFPLVGIIFVFSWRISLEGNIFFYNARVVIWKKKVKADIYYYYCEGENIKTSITPEAKLENMIISGYLPSVGRAGICFIRLMLVTMLEY